MSGFRNKTKKHTYINEEWEAGSSWTLRSELTDSDTDDIEALARTYVVTNIDDSEIKAAAKRGENVRDIIGRHVEPVVQMSSKHATLLHMSVAWDGPHFTVPEDFTIEDANGDVTPHPLAGQLAPLTAEYIGLLSTEDLDAVFWTMNKLWAGAERSPEEQKDFSGSSVGVDRPKRKSSPKTALSTSSKADRRL